MEEDAIHPLEIEAEEINVEWSRRKRIFIPLRNGVKGGRWKKFFGQPHGRGPHRKQMTEREIGTHAFNS